MLNRLVPFVLLSMAACGGGSSNPDAPPTTPDSPIASADGTPAADGALADGALPDAPNDGPPVARQMWAMVNQDLYRVDVGTGAIARVGATGLATLSFVDGAWDPSAGVMRVIVDAYGTPDWGTLDLCTGTITTGGAITLAGAARELEGVARDDAGTWYVGVDANNTNNFLTEAVGSVATDTGAVTTIGTSDTLQDDLDQLEWGGGALYALDVNTGANAAAIYSIAPATGVATLATNVSDDVRRIAWDPVGARMLGATAEDPRRLVSIDLATGALTGIGNLHTAAELGGELEDFIFFAPEPVCP